jgi:hypothetical protein
MENSLEETAAQISEFVRQPDAVIFVGSGISTWSGLPDWTTLLLNLVQEAEAKGRRTSMAFSALQHGQLLEAADAIDLTPSERVNALRISLRGDTAEPHRIHSLVTALGPKRFVTTNFDMLIEQQLQADGVWRNFRFVTASRIAEMADIIKASADRFVFKVHGDLTDAGSIVLSSRDYERLMLGQGTLVRQCLQTILLTRPVLFIGYGLRDPDLSLVLRSLTDQFLGNISHFAAIVPDAGEEERDYWWSRFRIRVFSYSTVAGPADSRDHSGLLELLARVVQLGARQFPIRVESRLPGQETNYGTLKADEQILARYAAGLVRTEEVEPLDVRAFFQVANIGWTDERHRFGYYEIVTALETFHDSFILEGMAGTGKSFGLKRYISLCGRRLLRWDEEGRDEFPPPIPVLLDARTYEGSFRQLLSNTVPTSLDLKRLSTIHRVELIVDSIDEMPQEHLDKAGWTRDLLELAGEFENYRIIYGSRRADLISRPDLPVLQVAGLTEHEIEKYLSRAGVASGQLSENVKELIRSPLLLTLSAPILRRQTAIKFTSDLLRAALDQLLAEVDQEGRTELLSALSAVAYDCVERGRETEHIAVVANKLGLRLRIPEDQAVDHINSLVRHGLLSSEVESHVRFIHRSITEYLASGLLKDRLRDGSVSLETVLSSKKWDNVLAWALSQPDALHVEATVSAIYSYDPSLAFRVVTSSEWGSTFLWPLFLQCMLDFPPDQDTLYEIEYLSEGIDVPASAESILRKLTVVDAGEVRGLAFRFLGPYLKDDDIIAWLDRAQSGSVEFNEANLCAYVIAGSLNCRSFDRLCEAIVRCAATPDDDEQRYSSAIQGVVAALYDDHLEKLLKWAAKRSPDVRSFICSSFVSRDDKIVYNYLVRQLDRGIEHAIFPLFLKIRYRNSYQDHHPLPTPTQRRMQTILRAVQAADDRSRWALGLLTALAKQSSSWRRHLDQSIRESRSTVKDALRIAHPSAKLTYLELKARQLLANPANAPELLVNALNQSEKRTFYVDESSALESLRNHGLVALNVLEKIALGYGDSGRLEVTSERVDDWIAITRKLTYQASDSEDDDFKVDRLIEYLAGSWSNNARDYIIRRATDPKDESSDFILGMVFPRLSAASTEELTDEASTRLLRLHLAGQTTHDPEFGDVASERYIEEVILKVDLTTLLPNEYERLSDFLKQAAAHVGRRYKLPAFNTCPGSSSKHRSRSTR